MEEKKFSNQKDTISFLASKYPKCFFEDGPVKPLKIGIFQDLAEDLTEQEDLSKRVLRMALRHYTSSWRYLACVKAGEARIDLQGVEGELVEQQHEEHATEQLKESKARAAKIRAEKQKANPSHKQKARGQNKAKNFKNNRRNDTSSNSSPDVKTKSKPNIRHKKRSSSADKLVASTQLLENELISGTKALVQLGKEPMTVVINKVERDGVLVQLKSGMTVKVQKHQLYKL